MVNIIFNYLIPQFERNNSFIIYNIVLHPTSNILIWILIIIFIKIYLILKFKFIKCNQNVIILKLLSLRNIFQTYQYFSFSFFASCSNDGMTRHRNTLFDSYQCRCYCFESRCPRFFLFRMRTRNKRFHSLRHVDGDTFITRDTLHAPRQSEEKRER